MSGIVGLYCFEQQPIDPEQLGQMLGSIVHRGPDRQDIWHDQHIGLAHCLLQTTPESLTEHQPLVSPKTGCVIVADVRIDNRSELTERLQLGPNTQLTDVDIVLAAYEQWGEQCPDELLGAFAFAIWDPQRERLFCARDHFGIKPFFYCPDDLLQPFSNCQPTKEARTFRFASEIKAILNPFEKPWPVNELRISEFIQSNLRTPEITVYQGIFRLCPGHWLSVSNTGINCQRYWQLQAVPKLHLSCDQDYADAFLSHFTEAVRCRLRSTTAVASHLSGGLDSSSVTCVARQLIGDQGQLHAFSNVFDDVPECDERNYINPVLDQGGLTPHYVHPDQEGPLSHWEQILLVGEEPCLMGGNGYLVRGLNQAVQAQNIRVCLDGFDGDTTVSHGLLYFSELAVAGDWSTFATEVKATAQRWQISSAALLRQYGFSYLKRLAQQHRWLAFSRAVNDIHCYFPVSRRQLWLKLGLSTLIPNVLWQAYRRLRKKENPSPSMASLLNPSLQKKQQTNWSKTGEESVPLTPQEEQLEAFNSSAFCHVLEQVDLLAATASIETRHPFMDKRLIEFCLSLPSDQRLRDGWSRWIMRHALQDILPDAVQWRGDKTVMTPSFVKGLLRFNKELMHSTIVEPLPSAASDYMDWTVVQSAYQRLIANTETSEVERQAIWKAVALSLWFNHC